MLSVLGKDLRTVRKAKRLTQKEYSKLLSKETGESITPKLLSRMENFGVAKAANPERPSSKVSMVVLNQLFYELNTTYEDLQIALNLLRNSQRIVDNIEQARELLNEKQVIFKKSNRYNPSFFFELINKNSNSVLSQQFSFAELDRNLIGMGIGFKIVKDKLKKKLCLKFYVKEKLPAKEVDENKFIPGNIIFDGLGSFPTDVEEVGPIDLENLKINIRPVTGGYSIGHRSVRVGSLGCLVRKRGQPNKIFLLSANHVIAASDTGAIGDAIFQPGIEDKATSRDVLTSLYDFEPLDFSEIFYDGKVDAAIAGPVTTDDCSSLIALIKAPPSGIREDIYRGMKIKKVGRSTGLTKGSILDVDLTLKLSYRDPASDQLLGDVRYTDLVLCTRYSKPGDSGSLILDSNNHAVGLHIAGTRDTWKRWFKRRSVFLKIKPVLDALNLDLVTEEI